MFDDLNDDIEFFNQIEELADDNIEALKVEPTYIENCKKCAGHGYVWLGYQHPYKAKCFACDGKGKFERKTSPEARAKAKASREAAKVRTANLHWSTFVSEHTEIANWMDANHTFEFAQSLKEAVIKFGSLTERQLAAAQKCVDKVKAARAAAEERRNNAPVISVEKLENAFATAHRNGLLRPKLIIAGFRFSPAPASGNNAGAIYVKADGVYLGKVQGGKFFASRDCNDAKREEIIAVASDPAAAAEAHGKRTGVCSCCGRQLTNEGSIDRGIGPICAEKYGW